MTSQWRRRPEKHGTISPMDCLIQNTNSTPIDTYPLQDGEECDSGQQ